MRFRDNGHLLNKGKSPSRYHHSHHHHHQLNLQKKYKNHQQGTSRAGNRWFPKKISPSAVTMPPPPTSDPHSFIISDMTAPTLNSSRSSSRPSAAPRVSFPIMLNTYEARLACNQQRLLTSCVHPFCILKPRAVAIRNGLAPREMVTPFDQWTPEKMEEQVKKIMT